MLPKSDLQADVDVGEYKKRLILAINGRSRSVRSNGGYGSFPDIQTTRSDRPLSGAKPTSDVRYPLLAMLASAFGRKTDAQTGPSERPFVARSGHSKCVIRPASTDRNRHGKPLNHGELPQSGLDHKSTEVPSCTGSAFRSKALPVTLWFNE